MDAPGAAVGPGTPASVGTKASSAGATGPSSAPGAATSGTPTSGASRATASADRPVAPGAAGGATGPAADRLSVAGASGAAPHPSGASGASATGSRTEGAGAVPGAPAGKASPGGTAGPSGASGTPANGARTPGAPATGFRPPGTPAPGTPARTEPGAPASEEASAARPGQAPIDPRRVVRGDVGVLAVPVVAETRVAVRPGGRRKNVIGAETTGSIPVHLLFREEPDADDDGGPATVAMPATVAPVAPAPAPKAVIPAPTRPEPSRPAPTADPKLVERAGAVLPGWIGVVAGALALTGCAAILWWVGAVPDQLTQMLRLPPRPYNGIHLGQWALLALGVLAVLFSLGGLGRGRVGYAWVLTLFGDYRGTVRRTGLVWVSPLLLRRRVDIRLRHWRSEPLSAVDAKGTALNVVVLVVWRIRDTVRAALGVDGHEEYLREQVEAAMARVLSQLPADAFHEDAPTLRDAEAVGEALTRMISAECAPVGIDVFSAQPTRIEYAPEIAAAMQRRRIAAIDAKHRDSVLTSVVDAVDDVVHRLTTRGLVELDDYERKALVKDLTVAFYTGRTGPVEGA
ncbi:SPFH domain-containing protein [Streptomyces sp. NPDC046324]|uniref:SPFH domain-containing protein n=1 Tax=Streptomyces sp. NPDC046324 TaxID=3154915 RepID=UPI0033F0771B